MPRTSSSAARARRVDGHRNKASHVDERSVTTVGPSDKCRLKAEMPRGRRTRADLVVEVTSPSSGVYDRGAKADTYRAMGVRELWLVDSVAKQVEVRSFEAGTTRIHAAGDVLRSSILPEIEIPVAPLFE